MGSLLRHFLIFHISGGRIRIRYSTSIHDGTFKRTEINVETDRDNPERDQSHV